MEHDYYCYAIQRHLTPRGGETPLQYETTQFPDTHTSTPVCLSALEKSHCTTDWRYKKVDIFWKMDLLLWNFGTLVHSLEVAPISGC
ncbi:hypothetical protein OUZ56_003851 [Daphnia magna]|uniref:Uncharacterized protein n=1 Tax=Daphnia magna TaxID=35525 RepID=A0ABQ9YNC1_9CRUS|nr:hypothetical protein OUZ56_003851 [Daphnia magna]